MGFAISINPVSNIQDILSFLIVIIPTKLDHEYFRHQEIQVYFSSIVKGDWSVAGEGKSDYEIGF